MKRTMNKRDVVRFHKFIQQGLNISEISRAMKTEVSTLEKFTPELVAESEDRKKKVADQIAAQRRAKSDGAPLAPVQPAAPAAEEPVKATAEEVIKAATSTKPKPSAAKAAAAAAAKD